MYGGKSLTQSKSTECLVPISRELSLMLRSNTLPHRRHTSCLQKGLVLIHRDIELSGEGTGFGVPALRYVDRDYFSGSSTMQTFHDGDRTTVVKKFILDVVLERNLRGLKSKGKTVRSLVRRLEELYQRHGNWMWLMLKKSLLETFGVETGFVQVKPVGVVPVVYRMERSRINVKADLSSLKRDGLEKIFLLNEQASSHFRRYHDSNGSVLFDEKIGPWENVCAKWASFSNGIGGVGFRLWNVEDAVMHRGREFLKDTFDWIGLDYEISPEKTSFEYDIEIFGGRKST